MRLIALTLALTTPAWAVDFAAPTAYPTTLSPESVAAGDLNGDGYPEVFVGGGYEQIALHRGDGKGGLLKAGYYDSKKEQTRVAVGDVDGDGVPDLVTNDARLLWVYYGNAKGLSQAQERLQAGKDPRSPHLVDVNGDGKLDLVAACGDGKLTVVLRAEEGFAKKERYKAGKKLTLGGVGDFDGDGDPDLVGYCEKLGALLLLRPDPKKGFALPKALKKGIPAGKFMWSLAVADLDGDGKDDVLTGHVGGALVPYWGDEAGLTRGEGLKCGRFITHLTTADIDGDGDADVVVCDRGGDKVRGEDGQVVVLLGGGDRELSVGARLDAGEEPRASAVVDMNKDGKLDVVVATSGREDEVRVFLQR